MPSRSPSALAIARLSRRPVFPLGGRDLFRRVARLIELGPGHEFLVVPCGRGVTAQFLAETSGAEGAGVDPDPELVESAQARVRRTPAGERLTFDTAPLEDLPYKDAVFDFAVGELGLAASADPAKAVQELARVTKPTGLITLIQLSWTGSVEPGDRDALIDYLGARPCLLVQWKRMLREAGVVDMLVEDWSNALGAVRRPVTLGGLAEFPSVRDELAVLYEAWRHWGWREVRELVGREREIRRLIVQERVLRLSLIKGAKCERAPAPA